jgi:hypothetical protein
MVIHQFKLVPQLFLLISEFLSRKWVNLLIVNQLIELYFTI